MATITELPTSTDTPTESTPTITTGHLAQVHLLIRVSNEFEVEDEVVAALSTDHEAVRLQVLYESWGSGETYKVRAVQVHSSAAAALGL